MSTTVNNMIEVIERDPTIDTPKVSFNHKTAYLEISGRSLPQNALKFYAPLHEWVLNYIENPGPKTTLNINLEYFNSDSAKQIFEIFLILKTLQDKKYGLEVNWFYNQDDIDIKEAGEKYSKLSNIPFNLIET